MPIAARVLLAVAALATVCATEARAERTLHAYEKSGTTVTVVFRDYDAFEFVYMENPDATDQPLATDPADYRSRLLDLRWPGDAQELGLKVYTATDGEPVLVPRYVAALRMVLVQARKYFEARGLREDRYSADNRLTVTVGPLEALGRVRWRPLLPMLGFDMEIRDQLDVPNLLTTPIHEWFHLITHSRWPRTITSGVGARKMVSEGVAEWASDLPVPLQGIILPDPHGNYGTADEVNSYYRDRALAWFTESHRRPWARGLHEVYSSCILWKRLSQVAGADEDAQLNLIKQFLDRFERRVREVPASRAFLDALGHALPGGVEGAARRARDFLGDLAVSQLVQWGDPLLGFEDDAFQGNFITPGPASAFAGSTSSPFPEVVASVAPDEGAVRERLALLAREPARPVEQYGSTLFSIHPPAFKHHVAPKSPTLFVWAGTAADLDRLRMTGLIQSSGAPTARGPGIQFTPQEAFALQPAAGAPAGGEALQVVEGFSASEKRARYWIAVANTDPEARRLDFRTAYVITPVFVRRARRGGAMVEYGPGSADRPGRVHYPEDALELEVRLSSRVDAGAQRGAALASSERSLDVELLDAEGQTIADASWEVRYAGTARRGEAFLYRAAAKLPRTLAPGGYVVRFVARSPFKLGAKDRVQVEWPFRVVPAAPHVDVLTIVRGGEEFYANHRGLRRPLSPGAYEVSVTFDEAMDREQPAVVMLAGREITGRWEADKIWIGTLELPDGFEFDLLRGEQYLSVQARSVGGRPLDGDPDLAGDQPAQFKVFVDTEPILARSVAVRTSAGMRYAAVWRDRQSLEDRWAALRHGVAGVPREAMVTSNEPVPGVGSATIEVAFEGGEPASATCRVGYGGTPLTLERTTDDRWSATIDLGPVARAQAGTSPVPLLIDAADSTGKTLDAVPATAAVLYAPRPAEDALAAWAWDGYEGGTDASHWIQLAGDSTCLEPARILTPRVAHSVDKAHWLVLDDARPSAELIELFPPCTRVTASIEFLDARHGFIGFNVDEAGEAADGSRTWRALYGALNGGFAFKQLAARVLDVPPGETLRAYRFGFRRNRDTARIALSFTGEPWDDLGLRRDAGTTPETMMDAPLGRPFVGHLMRDVDTRDGYRVAHVPPGHTVRATLSGVRGSPHGKLFIRLHKASCDIVGARREEDVERSGHAGPNAAREVECAWTADEPCHVYVIVDRAYASGYRYELEIEVEPSADPANEPEKAPAKKGPVAGKSDPAEPEREPEPGPEPEPRPAPDASWVLYTVEVEKTLHANRIFLVKGRYKNRSRRGRALAHFVVERFPVVYAVSEGRGAWRIARGPASRKRLFAWEKEMPAAYKVVRERAAEFQKTGGTRAKANRDISRAVQAAGD